MTRALNFVICDTLSITAQGSIDVTNGKKRGERLAKLDIAQQNRFWGYQSTADGKNNISDRNIKRLMRHDIPRSFHLKTENILFGKYNIPYPPLPIMTQSL